jgi:hypothetical protein
MLKRIPGHHERSVYLAVIAVLTLCLVAVMFLNRCLLTARVHERQAYAQLLAAMEQAREAAAIAQDARREAEIRADAAEVRARWSHRPVGYHGLIWEPQAPRADSQ